MEKRNHKAHATLTKEQGIVIGKLFDIERALRALTEVISDVMGETEGGKRYLRTREIPTPKGKTK